MSGAPRGCLIVIGGSEERLEGERKILRELADRAGRRKGSLVVVTAATNHPDEVADTYRQAFGDLGVKGVEVLDIRSREDAQQEENLAKVRQAALVFFTGGDQLRITSQMGDSLIYRCLEERYRDGMTIAGTSAGAAAMPETMLISGPSDQSHEISALGMAPGLGFLPGVVIDSHFAERGRFGRLFGAVAQNPRNLGIGIDENTAILVDRGRSFRVIGGGAVYVVDGCEIGYSSLSERAPAGILTIHDLRVHVLGDGAGFDLTERRPSPPRNGPDG